MLACSTNLAGARALIANVPRNQPDILYVSLNDRDRAWHDLYRVSLSTGERTLVRKNTDRVAGLVFDTRDELRLAARTTNAGDTEILRIDPERLTKIYECSVFETCNPARFHKDGRRVYIVTNKGDADLMHLALLDVTTGAVEVVESDPDKRVDLGRPLFSEVTDELVGTTYVDERVRVYLRDPARNADYENGARRCRTTSRGASGTSSRREWPMPNASQSWELLTAVTPLLQA